ncbi:MAG: hypothetical protein LKJ94_01385 [Candidatus Methanomethylophilus sp.]|nr:hypothetical protein [Methanomethylophilus sp.]MCI2074352.1 hypothetical protein [Methanomethylophilus sp.]MCI2092851.1 hypothetical protein [Methanomethylophilus sp.]WII09620.1 hypothetical protein O8W32_02010 [Methanomassiliicoccales archaeon LGM-DZ1]
MSRDIIGPGTAVGEVISDPAFGDFGRLLFPIGRGVRPEMALKEISTPRTLVWYTDVRAEETVEIIAELKRRAEAGKRIFIPLYSEEEISRDPSAADTGLFFFSGRQGAPFAVTCPGGGFAYVAALHDGLPHALALSKLGYNAFTLIYRTECPYDASHAHSGSSRAMQRSWGSRRTVIHCGEALRAPAWQPRSAIRMS